MPIEVGPKRTIFGVCVHTTGQGIPDKAAKENKGLLETARTVYESMQLVGPHFCIAPDGKYEQYADPELVRYHVGLEPEHRRSFLDGHWMEDANRIDRKVVAWWKARWPGVKSPSHLYPGDSANKAYIGIELIPAGRYIKQPGGSSPWIFDEQYSRPGFDKQRFSVEQYAALADLLKELAMKYNIDYSKVGRLIGHEDANLYTRPGYDPGSYNQTFSWGMVWGLLGIKRPIGVG